MSPQIAIDRERLARFCRQHHIRKLALFGSVLREDFRPDSDVDVMVVFAEDAHWGLFKFNARADELESLFSRRVDFMTRRSVEDSENWLRRRHILEHAEVIFAA